MRKLTLALSLLFCAVFFVGTVNAQLSKTEAKEWKKKIKKLDPEGLKTLVETNESLKEEVSELNSEIAGSQNKVNNRDAKISVLQDKIAGFEKQIVELEGQLALGTPVVSTPESEGTDIQIPSNDGESSSVPKGPVTMDGVVFKVQIGAFRNKDLKQFFQSGGMFKGESDGDGVQRYTIGQFKDYWVADKFKKYLRAMGVRDAWVVPYKDGRRVPIKEVLSGIVNN